MRCYSEGSRECEVHCKERTRVLGACCDVEYEQGRACGANGDAFVQTRAVREFITQHEKIASVAHTICAEFGRFFLAPPYKNLVRISGPYSGPEFGAPLKENYRAVQFRGPPSGPQKRTVFQTFSDFFRLAAAPHGWQNAPPSAWEQVEIGVGKGDGEKR